MLGRLPLALIVFSAGSAFAQQVISAHSGVIQYVEGTVQLDGKNVAPKFAEFPEVKTGQTLAATDGRAEVLLTPGVFLRLAENSSFTMVSNKLADTKVEIVSGSALVQVCELLDDNAITLQFQGAQIALLKKGLYRVDADSARFRVYDGEARVTSGSETVDAKRGREVGIGAVLEANKFDTKQTDAFYRWSARRDEYVAQANVVAARTAGFSGNSFAKGAPGTWAYNSWLGMFSFIPSYGTYYSPFGSAYYSPVAVVQLYQPRPTFAWNSGLGMSGVPNSSPLSVGAGAGAAAPMSVGHSAPSSGAAISPGGMRGGGHH